MRFGTLGRIDWFGTIHSIALQRDDLVIVRNMEGEWLAQVLAESAARVGDAGTAEGGQRITPHGEILRKAMPEDQQQAERATQAAIRLVALARQLTASLPTPITVLDADVSLDHHCGIVTILQSGTASLGPLAVRLADECQLDRIQWLPYHDTLVAEKEETIGRELAGTSPAATATDLVNVPQLSKLLETKLDAATDIPGWVKLAKQQRDSLGILGLYSQKQRASSAPSRDGRSATQRYWMIRLKTNGGALTAGQFQRLCQLAGQWGDGTLRLTMRQGLQLHGVHWGQPKEVLQQLDAIALSTRGACGNSLRNVTCCARQPQGEAEQQARRLAASISRQLLPDARWLDAVVQPAEMAEEISSQSLHDAAYPNGYPPHKWKVGVMSAGHNCIDVLCNDLGIVVRWSERLGWLADCYVGGSTAYRANRTASLPRLASPLLAIPLAAVPCLIDDLIRLHGEMSAGGERWSRRLKMLVISWGIERLRDWARQQLSTRHAIPLTSIEACHTESLADWQLHQGWEAQENGLWCGVIAVPGGRLGVRSFQQAWLQRDSDVEMPEKETLPGAGDQPSLAAWQELWQLGCSIAVATGHRLLISNATDAQRQRAEAWQSAHLPPQNESVSTLACVSFPTCPFAQSEAERHQAVWRAALAGKEDDLRWFLGRDRTSPLTISISGCSHGCAHPLTVALGIVGESPRRFRVALGGTGKHLGTFLLVVAGPSQLVEQLDWLVKKARASRRNLQETPLQWAKTWLDSPEGLANFPWPTAANRLS